MFFYYLNIFLTYFVVGLAVAIYFIYVLKKRILGHFWGALVIALLGSFLGGFIDQYFSSLIKMLSDFNSVNLFAATITSLLLIWLFSKASALK